MSVGTVIQIAFSEAGSNGAAGFRQQVTRLNDARFDARNSSARQRAVTVTSVTACPEKTTNGLRSSRRARLSGSSGRAQPPLPKRSAALARQCQAVADGNEAHVHPVVIAE